MRDDMKEIAALLKSLEQKLTDQQDQIRQLKNRLMREESNQAMPEKKVLQQKSEPQKFAAQSSKEAVLRPERPTAQAVKKSADVGDTELWIGKYGLQILGVMIFLFGAGFGLKYSIEKGWISPFIRFLGTIISGLASIGLAEFLHQKLKKWVDACLGGGIALLYGGIYFGYTSYGLFPAHTALIATALISLLAVFLAARYSSQTIATLSVLGSFLLPFFGNLFTTNYLFHSGYCWLIASVSLVMACMYDWVGLATVAFFGFVLSDLATPIIFTPWSVAGAFAVFTLLPMAFSLVRKHNWFTPLIIVVSGIHSFIWLRRWQGWYVSAEQVAALLLCFCVVYSVLYLVSYLYIKRVAQERKELLETFIVLAIASFAGAIFVYFTGPVCTVALATYALLIYIVGIKYMSSKIVRASAMGVWFISLLSQYFWMLPGRVKPLSVYLPYILSDVTAVYVALIGIFLCAAYVVHQNKEKLSAYESNTEYFFEVIALTLGLRWFFSAAWPGFSSMFAYRPAGLTIYATLLFVFGIYYKRYIWRIFSIIAGSLSMAVVVVYFRGYLYNVHLLIPHVTFGLFALATLVCACFAQRYKHHLSKQEEFVPEVLKMAVPVTFFVWGYVAIVSYFGPSRSDSRYTLKDPLLMVYYMVCAIAFIAVGLLKRLMGLRYFGLGLVVLALLKLGNIIWQLQDTVYRIIAFMLVGILIILISFIYQYVSKRVDDAELIK